MFRNKVAVITGGASGIGLALAQAFGREGASLVLADLDEVALRAAVADLQASGAPVLGVPVDVTDRASVASLAGQTLERFGRVDILCNNAGVATFGPIAMATAADWEFTMGVNFWGVVHGVEAFLPILLEQASGGHIVNTASMSGLIGMENLSVYCASKFAVVGLSESMARELKPAGIGVTVVCPMVVDTPINENSVRMRPDALRNPNELVVDPGSLVGSVVGADRVAERVVSAVRNGDLYVLTHPEQRTILERRAARLDDAAARIEP